MSPLSLDRHVTGRVAHLMTPNHDGCPFTRSFIAGEWAYRKRLRFAPPPLPNATMSYAARL